MPTSEQLLWAHWWCFCAAHYLLLPSLLPLGTPSPCLWTVQILKYVQSAEPHWLRPHPVACPSNGLWKKDTGSRLYRVSWLFLTGIVTFISCAFSARFSSLQILRNSLQFRWCLQMEWWAAVTIVAIPSQPALLTWPYVSTARPSVLSPRALSRYSAQTTPCWLHLAYFD